MPVPLSSDLRERIVRAVAKGSSIRQAALRFEVSPSAAVKLMRRVRESGSPAPARLVVTAGRCWTSTRRWCARCSMPSLT
jgi:transposase